jgi:hypothetical protein
LKYFTGRQVLYEATTQKKTTQEQAGGRPGRRAIDEAVQTIINYETCSLQHKFGGVTYNDATACYDRIPENLGSISAMKEGFHPNLAALHNQTNTPRLTNFTAWDKELVMPQLDEGLFQTSP